MSQRALPTIPITELRTRQPEIIDGLKESPVMLTRQGYGAGVLVHPDQWNKLVAEVERYKRMARLQRIRHEMDSGVYFSGAEGKADLEERGLL